MEFLTKREEYVTTYSLEQAVKLLKDDRRIETIEVERQPVKEMNEKKKNVIVGYRNVITIHTKVIYVKSREKRFNDYYDYPIGFYKIILEERRDCYGMNIDIKRLEGDTPAEDWQHIHLNRGWSNPICWGNMGERIQVMKKYKDWYWVAIMCLELLEDGEQDDNLDIGDMHHIFLGLQVTFEEEHRCRPAVINKLKGRYRKLVRSGEDYDEGWGIENEEEENDGPI